MGARLVSGLLGALPGEVQESSDAYDAAICAVLAAGFIEPALGLELVEPSGEALAVARREGWIYWPRRVGDPTREPWY